MWWHGLVVARPGGVTFSAWGFLSVCLAAKRGNAMTKDGFLMYLLSDEGNIFNPSHRKVYQDMTQPLSHYLVSSSHNTYLMEDQITGPSSTEAYIR